MTLNVAQAPKFFHSRFEGAQAQNIIGQAPKFLYGGVQGTQNPKYWSDPRIFLR